MSGRGGRGTIAAIGEASAVSGFALGGAHVLVAEGPDEVGSAWRSLPASVVVVVLTAGAAHALGAQCLAPGGPLTVVLPP